MGGWTFHEAPPWIVVAAHRFPPPNVDFPGGAFGEPFAAPSTSALPLSFHRCTPASTTVPVVGSARATWIRISFSFSLNIFAKSPVPCTRTRSAYSLAWNDSRVVLRPVNSHTYPTPPPTLPRAHQPLSDP